MISIGKNKSAIVLSLYYPQFNLLSLTSSYERLNLSSTLITVVGQTVTQAIHQIQSYFLTGSDYQYILFYLLYHDFHLFPRL